MDAYEIERIVFGLINELRLWAKIPTLKRVEKLDHLTRCHGANMVNEIANGKMDWNDPRLHIGFDDRYEQSGCRSAGEIIAVVRGDNPLDVAGKAKDKFLSSNPHREEIYNSIYFVGGVGVFSFFDHFFVITQFFGKY